MTQNNKTKSVEKSAAPKANVTTLKMEKKPENVKTKGEEKSANTKVKTEEKSTSANVNSIKPVPTKVKTEGLKKAETSAATEKNLTENDSAVKAPELNELGTETIENVLEAKDPVSHHPATFGLTIDEINAIVVDAGSPIDTSKPYNPIFAERVPLMELFAQAVSNAVVQNAIGADGSKPKKSDINILECGVYRGRGSRAMLEIAEKMNVPVHLTMLDTFEGLPELSENDLKMAPKNVKYVRRKVFADTTVREVEAYIGSDFSSTIEIHKGLFSETLPNLDSKRRYAFVFIDCDLYEGHIETLSYVYDKMIPGGIIMFDDYYSKEYPMAMAAVDNFMADKPESIFRMRFGTYRSSRPKAYIVK